MLLTGVSGVFFDLNPLMKFDGYFPLNLYPEIDNLRDDSFNYSKVWARRTLLPQDVDFPPVGRRKRRIFLCFGLASVLYSALILIGVALFARNVFTQEFGILGYPVAAGALYLMLRKWLRPRLPAVQARVREVKEKLMAWKMTRLQQVVGGAIVVLAAVLPTATEVRTDFVLEPLRAEVRAPFEGWISEVRARESQPVEAGGVLAVLRNPELEARVTILDQDLAVAERALVAAQVRGDLGSRETRARDPAATSRAGSRPRQGCRTRAARAARRCHHDAASGAAHWGIPCERSGVRHARGPAHCAGAGAGARLELEDVRREHRYDW